VNLFDTANYYSNGASEAVLGEALHQLGLPRDEYLVASKARLRVGNAPNSVGLTRVHLMAEVDKSLRRLKVDHIDLYQAHAHDPLTPLEETLRAFDDLVASGKVRHIGLSNFSAWNLVKALGIADSRGWHRPVSHQVYYSIASRDIEREIVPACQDQGVGILVWSPLSGGYLAGKYMDGPSEGRRDAFPFPPVDSARGSACLSAMRQVSDRMGASLAQIALRYIADKPAVSSVLLGARCTDQLKETLAAADCALSDDDRALLDTASALQPEYPAWMHARQGSDRLAGLGSIGQLPD
jgi:aryl-alcohol dehydrogenase-like predicted oxidoreductase